MTAIDCTCQKTTIAELRNRFVLENNVPNADRWAEHIVVWAFDIEKRLAAQGTFEKLVEEYKINSTQFRLPNCVYKVKDVCIPGRNIKYSGTPRYGSFTTTCSCSSTCGCLTWSIQGKKITFSEKVSKAKVTFLGIQIDDEGWPMIDEDHVDTINAYISFKMAEMRFKEGKVSHQVYYELKRTYGAKIRATRAKDNIPRNDAEINAIASIMNAILPYRISLINCDDDPCASTLLSPSQQTSRNVLTIVKNTLGGNGWDVINTTGNGTDTYTNALLVGLTEGDMLVFNEGTLLKFNDPTAGENEIIGFDGSTGTIQFLNPIDANSELRIFYRVIIS